MSQHLTTRGILALQCVHRGDATQLDPAVLVNLVEYGYAHHIRFPSSSRPTGRWILTKQGLTALAQANRSS